MIIGHRSKRGRRPGNPWTNASGIACALLAALAQAGLIAAAARDQKRAADRAAEQADAELCVLLVAAAWIVVTA